jgi:hypothetical protein
MQETDTGTSIFDPVLCEIAYTWYSKNQDTILDPFAGGSVRGIIAGKLERKYVGCELRAEQVESNRIQLKEILPTNDNISWHIGDSNKTLDTLEIKADMIFSCPPYADLEIYSDDPSDISNMNYEDFLATYKSIIKKSLTKLKDDRFIIWVVSEIRDKKGNMRGLINDTIKAFEDENAKYYNEIILLTPVGNQAMRAGKTFRASRKLAKVHQTVLCFIKGDHKKATQRLGEVKLAEIEEHEYI